MTAREQIERLTNAWYGFAFVTGVLTLVQSGFGLFSILSAAASTCLSFLLTFYLGRRLLARSSFWRTVLVVVAFFGMIFGALGTARLAWAFVQSWSISTLVATFAAGALASMYFRSVRVLTDRTVKAYFD
jgi:hypothetical protein